MNYLHQEFDAGPGDIVEVTLDHAANVQLLDRGNFEDYQRGRTFRYFGGYATRSPFRLQPPRQDRWHLVIDLGGAAGSVRAGVRIINAVTT